jgi:hypothetical protein
VIGLRFRETMSGGYHLTSAPGVDRPMYFTIQAQAPRLRSLLAAPVLEIEGAVFAEGFADHRHLRGTLTIDPLRAKVLVYLFDFDANDGKRYTFQGRKTLSEGDLLHAMTVLPGGIYDAAGEEVGRALLRFDLRSDIVKFLRSFRLVRS